MPCGECISIGYGLKSKNRARRRTSLTRKTINLSYGVSLRSSRERISEVSYPHLAGDSGWAHIRLIKLAKSRYSDKVEGSTKKKGICAVRLACGGKQRIRSLEWGASLSVSPSPIHRPKLKSGSQGGLTAAANIATAATVGKGRATSRRKHPRKGRGPSIRSPSPGSFSCHTIGGEKGRSPYSL